MDVVRVTVETEESVRSCGPRRLGARCASEAGGGGSAVKIALCRKTAAAIDAAARGCSAQEGTTHWQMGARGMQYVAAVCSFWTRSVRHLRKS